MKKAIIIQTAATLTIYIMLCFAYWELNPINWRIGDYELFSDFGGRVLILCQISITLLIGFLSSVSAWGDYEQKKRK